MNFFLILSSFIPVFSSNLHPDHFYSFFQVNNKFKHDPLLLSHQSSWQVTSHQVVQQQHLPTRKTTFPQRSTNIFNTNQVNQLVITRKPKACNFVEYKDYKIVYKRYASLYFITIVDKDENELIVLEMIHTFVEVLDKYLGNVCELDLIFNFHKVFSFINQTYFIIDELIMAGFVSESNKNLINNDLHYQKEVFD